MDNIEKAFTRLEEINEKIRDSQLPLSDATSLFEEGISISNKIEKSLDKVEERIEIVMNSANDEENEAEFKLFSDEE